MIICITLKTLYSSATRSAYEDQSKVVSLQSTNSKINFCKHVTLCKPLPYDSSASTFHLGCSPEHPCIPLSGLHKFTGNLFSLSCKVLYFSCGCQSSFIFTYPFQGPHVLLSASSASHTVSPPNLFSCN